MSQSNTPRTVYVCIFRNTFLKIRSFNPCNPTTKSRSVSACLGCRKEQYYLIKSLNHFHQNPLLSGRHGDISLPETLSSSLHVCSCWDCFYLFCRHLLVVLLHYSQAFLKSCRSVFLCFGTFLLLLYIFSTSGIKYC